MLRNHYSPVFASGTVCAVGTLGILIPPSIMLVLMADRTPGVDAGGLFMGALIPGVLLGVIYIFYMVMVGMFSPATAPVPADARRLELRDVTGVLRAVFPPALLIVAVLGSIFAGIATPTEAAGVGAFGATLLAVANRKLSWAVVRQVCEQTTKTTAFIFAIFIGATAFSVLLIIFLLGFFLDWIEITLIVLPLVAPVIAGLDVGPDLESARMIWFVVLVAVCLQTSFLTPPVGFALFYLKGVAPKEVTVTHIYKGVVPFILLQLGGLALVYIFPSLATWLPEVAYGK
jgi:TRAP-type mannitol/chloroaromatic compound transport system permease large subunit